MSDLTLRWDDDGQAWVVVAADDTIVVAGHDPGVALNRALAQVSGTVTVSLPPETCFPDLARR